MIKAIEDKNHSIIIGRSGDEQAATSFMNAGADCVMLTTESKDALIRKLNPFVNKISQ